MSPGTGAAGMFTTDVALVVQSWDRWMAEATGLEEAEARGRPLAELFPELEARGLLARLRRVASLGTVEVLAPAFHEYLVPCPPRAPSAHFARMQQHVTMEPLRAGDALLGVAVTIADVTARRERERALAGQLQSPDDAVRLHAVRTLASAEGAAAPLAAALGDPNWQVRRAAADGLARERDRSVVDVLLDALQARHRDPATLNATLAALVAARHDVVPPLLALLHAAGSDADLRTYVALSLGLLADPRAVPALAGALDDADANVRFHAIEALGRIRSREAALPVLAVAESRDFATAFAALDTLALVGEPSVAPRVVALLDDDLLQPAAVDTLGRIGGEEVVGPLVALLGAPGADAAGIALALAAIHRRATAVRGAGEIVADLARALVTPEGADALLAAVDHADERAREALAVVLGWLPGAGADDALVRLLAHPGSRTAAEEALARRGATAVPPLLRVLRAGDDDVRKAAAAALGRVGAPDAVPALADALEGPPDVAVVACGALGGIGDARAFEPLLARLDDPDAGVRHAAVAALHSIGHPDTAGRLGALLGHASPRVREGAARIAGYFGFAACVEPMLERCADEDESVRRAAVEQLAHLADPRARARLGEALATGSPGVRAAAARALAHVHDAAAPSELLGACDDADPWVRYYAARSAGHRRSAEAVPVLAGLASGDAVTPVRIAAVDALAATGDADAVAGLAPLVDDPDPILARAAILAVGAAGTADARRALHGALDAPDPVRRLAALEALAALPEGSEMVDAADAAEMVDAVARLARPGGDPETAARALEVLVRMHDASAMAALVALLADPRRTEAVVSALARADATLPAWGARGLAHPDVHARCATLEALGRSSHADAPALVARALHDASPAVRAAAAHALGQLDLRAARAAAPGDDRVATREPAG